MIAPRFRQRAYTILVVYFLVGAVTIALGAMLTRAETERAEARLKVQRLRAELLAEDALQIALRHEERAAEMVIVEEPGRRAVVRFPEPTIAISTATVHRHGVAISRTVTARLRLQDDQPVIIDHQTSSHPPTESQHGAPTLR